jgi:hypothetical protein
MSRAFSSPWSLPAAALADAINADFDSFDQPEKGGALEGLRVQANMVRTKAFHFSTFYAIEMGVLLVVGIWGQPVAKRAVAGTNALNQFVCHQEVKNSVDSNPVNIPAPVQGGNNLLRTDGVGAVSDNFQDTQSIGSLSQTTMFNEVHIITLIAHNLLPFSDRLFRYL